VTLFDSYRAATPLGVAAWDEMFDLDGEVRPHYRSLFDILGAMSASDFADRATARDRSFRDQGITFSLKGEERPFPMDLIPRLLTAQEWTFIESGVMQRVRALEAFLADAYGRQEIVKAGLFPRRLITSSAHFHREAFGIDPANGVRVHVSGVDLVRDVDGSFAVLEDNLRTPSGVSYVVENRRAMTRVFPELFADHGVRPVNDYPERLLNALRASAPKMVDAAQARVVLLTPGVHNSAYFEHSFLARQMGVELVEGTDLIVRNNVVYMRSTEGERKVDVVYRRIDDDFLDPLHFRPDSVVGCPGLLNAARAGMVTIANAVGNGVADDKLTYTYVPDMIRFYLREEPILKNVETHRLDDPDVRASVVDRLDEFVSKPVDASGGYGIVVGPHASDEELSRLRADIEADPRSWIAQRPVTLSTSPTYVGSNVGPRHLDLRPFAVNDGSSVWVVAGGLSRVALREGNLIVNSSQGGGSKDTWVLIDHVSPDVGSDVLSERTFHETTTRLGVSPAMQTGPAERIEQQQQQQQARPQAQQKEQQTRREDTTC
jgi:uncharacterized circularly permuted ATP-grasp superfamily protein